MSSKRYPLAVDIGGTKTAVAAYREGEMVEIARIPTPRDPNEAIEALAEIIASPPGGGKTTAVGIGAPGPLDAMAGRFLAPPNLPGWRDFPFVEALSDRTGIPARLENDANLGALGEAHFGSGRGYPSLFYLTISTGIGAGVVIGGELHDGYRGLAGECWAVEPGFFTGEAGGPTVMDLASGPGLERAVGERIDRGIPSSLDRGSLDARDIVRAAVVGDRAAEEALQAGRYAIAGLLMTAIALLAPDVVVLGGGLCTHDEWYVEPIRRLIRGWKTIKGFEDLPVEKAELWGDAVLYGAVKLVENTVS